MQGEVDDLKEVSEVSRSIHTANLSILEEYEGVLKDEYMLCSHCKMTSNDPVKRWLPHQVFPEEAATTKNISCGADSVPRALLVALSPFPGE